jgi:hypothetical protein
MKKAQIKMAENIGILVIFFFLLVISLVFYSNIQRRTISYEVQKSIGTSAIEIAHTAASMPELQCSEPLERETERYDCIDLYKLISFSKLNESTGNDAFVLFYYDFLKNSRLSVTEVYPNPGQPVFAYDNPKAVYSDMITVHIPVFIFDELDNRPLGSYHLGDLKLEVYS